VKARAMPNKLLVHNMEKGGRRLSSGIVLPNDDGKDHGVRCRWAQVYSVGDQVRGIQEGMWVLMEHGRWSRGMALTPDLVLHSVDWKTGILAWCESQPFELDNRS
jgi:hypothetical protein